MRDYNFFEIYQSKKGLNIKPTSPFFIGALIILLCVLLSAGAIARNVLLTQDILAATSELDSMKASEEYILADKLLSNIDSMKKYEEEGDLALENFQSSDILNTALLTALFKGVPVNGTLTDFYIDSANVEMTFEVPDRKSAATLLLGLKETDLFLDLHLSSVYSGEDVAGFSADIHGILKAGEIE